MTVMTFSSLKADVQQYADRSDSPFVDQIPKLVALAELRIATEVHALGYRKFGTTTFEAGQPVSQKPSSWRETVSISIGVGTGQNEHKHIFYREYQYCRRYWPLSTQTGEPRYYSDYDFEHWLVVPTPDRDYASEVAYHERPIPLSEDVQQNWTTKYAPQLILYATLLEAQPFLMRPERTAEFQSLYDRAASAITNEEKRRLLDDASARKDGT